MGFNCLKATESLRGGLPLLKMIAPKNSVFETLSKIFFISWKSHVYKITLRRCAYQGVRNVRFSENFAYVLNEYPLLEIFNLKILNHSMSYRNCDVMRSINTRGEKEYIF